MQQAYIALKPNPDGAVGFTAWRVIYFDIKGNVPKSIVNYITKRQFTEFEETLQFLRKLKKEE